VIGIALIKIRGSSTYRYNDSQKGAHMENKLMKRMEVQPPEEQKEITQESRMASLGR
jgi:hypothetical protein